MSERALVTVLLALGAGCATPPPATARAPAAPATTASTAPRAAPAASSAAATEPPAGAGRPCGDLDCLAFPTPRAAFERALQGSPRVIAIGEAHAQKAMGNVESAAHLFTRLLLPALAPRVKGLVVELLAPDRRCEHHEEQAVAERTKPVTLPQKESNQSEYLALGFEAKKFGMRVEPLIPTCAELEGVLATDNDVGALLELIAKITVREAEDFLDHQPEAAAIAIYGGLVHNDVAPTAGHERWSFGPELGAHAKQSYVEIDLVVPELIQSGPPWSDLPWYAHYDAGTAGTDTLLYRTGPASFVLIFPRSAAFDDAKGTP